VLTAPGSMAAKTISAHAARPVVAPTRLNPSEAKSEPWNSRASRSRTRTSSSSPPTSATPATPATADLLDNAVVTNQARVGLTIRDRENVLSVLTDPPAGLTQLRAVLLEEHVLRKQTGLWRSPERR